MRLRPSLLYLVLVALVCSLSTGCVTWLSNVLADDTAFVFARVVENDEKLLAREKRGGPPPQKGRSWCVYWRLRFTTLRRVTQGQYYAEASRQHIAYLKRRRAEEGLPACDRPLILIYYRDRGWVPTEPEDAPPIARPR